MTVKEYTESKLKELQKHASKDIKTQQENTSAEDRDFNAKFWKALATGNRDELARLSDVTAEKYNSRYATKAQDVETIGTGTAGGVLVPTTVADSIISKMFYISPVRQIATVIGDMPAQFQLPSEDQLVQAYWVAEGAPGTDSGEVFAPNMLTPFKMMGLDSFTSEVIADAATNPSIQNYVEDRFAIALALLENSAFVNGDGTGKPYGFRSSAITPNSVAQAADYLTYSDMISLKYSLGTAYRKIGVFLVSSAGAQALESVKDRMGRPIWREGLAEDSPATVLGRPVYVVDEIPEDLVSGTNDNTTEIWFGNFKNMFVGDRGGLRVDYGTNGTDFANDKISLRMAKRVAGRPVIGTSFSKLTGVLAA